MMFAWKMEVLFREYCSGGIPCKAHRAESDVHYKKNQRPTNPATKSLSDPNKRSLHSQASSSSQHYPVSQDAQYC
jgi:hypothetical protein